MKLRTLSSDWTVLKKDLTRFAPAWILYTVAMLVTLMVCNSSNYNTASKVDAMASTAYAMSIVGFCYALLNVQLLFGDLFQSRMANSLHAMPLRRERWFAIHTAAGLLFALVPNLIVTLIMLPLCSSIPAMPWLWFLWSMGQYVFFFGLALLCTMCVGSRFALVVVYGIANFGSLLVCWLYDTVFLPLLDGLVLDFDSFLKFSPVCYSTIHVPFEVTCGKLYVGGCQLTTNPVILTYLGILTVLGVLLGGLALVMYRRRQLENAGDFISAGWMKPIFLVAYTVAMGVVFQFVLGLFSDTEWLYLIIGLMVGYFTGQMLLMRTARIFVKQTFLGLAVLLAVTAASLGLTVLDPLAVTRWVPEAEEVAHVAVYMEGNQLDGEDGADLDLLLQFHQTILDNRDELLGADSESSSYLSYTQVSITYTMKDGSTVQRCYTIPTQGTAFQVVEPMLHRPEVVLGELYNHWEALQDQVTIANYYRGTVAFETEDWEAFMAALEQDCAEGTMIQIISLHEGDWYGMEFWWQDPNGTDTVYYNLHIFPESTHLRQWLLEQDWYDGELERWNADGNEPAALE